MHRIILTAMMMCFLMLTSNVYANDAVNLNTASVEQLQELHGIGEKTAMAIVAYRDMHGDFKSVDDLVAVKGIGEKKLSKIEDDIKVSDASKHDD